MMQQQQSAVTIQHNFEPLLTAEEVAVHLRCHLKTVQKMAKAGRMPAIRQGKRYFFRLSEVDSWLNSFTTTPGSRPN
jgi:excisionase family DNA binding protein